MHDAAFEPRIKHIIALPATYWGLDMTLKQMWPGTAQQLVALFKARDRNGTEALVAAERLPSSVFDWCVTQGIYITDTHTLRSIFSRQSPPLARRYPGGRRDGRGPVVLIKHPRSPSRTSHDYSSASDPDRT